MTYEVTYQVGGDEQTDSVEAQDAASAAAMVREAHRTDNGQFELLLVHLVEDGEAAQTPAAEDLAASI